MNKNQNKIQHFVPQCYLRNFSPNGIYVFIYDKIAKKQYRNSVDKIAYEDFFYELPESFITNLSEIPFGTKFYEKEFFANNVESLFTKLLEKIVEKQQKWINNRKSFEVFNNEEKYLFAQLIAIQYLRMPNIREKYSDASKKHINAEQKIIKAFLSKSKPELKDSFDKINVQYNKAYDPILHSEIFANIDLFVGMAEQLINKHWIFYYNDNNDFFTSDNPIIVKPHIQKQKPYYEGFGMRGVEIIFPISSTILLSILDEDYFKISENLTAPFNKISDKKKREYNFYQYMFSNRQTYSYNNDFSIIEMLISLNKGEEFFGPKSKILVNGK
ncbi:DUF4238 domain-containing protein [Saccharicrinis aurantiacus]|uniref:DUF4238 domain-containing protein n=1 Tax=Saccharicrinis aurantiacus TaxID=1849719 RepID=UPI0024937A65|nr:DUF4238 domain-containing protein [Saccharicrinis aurantiacus]